MKDEDEELEQIAWDWEGLTVTREKMAVSPPKALDAHDLDGKPYNFVPGDEFVLTTRYVVTEGGAVRQKVNNVGRGVGPITRNGAAKPKPGMSAITGVTRRAEVEKEFLARIERGGPSEEQLAERDKKEEARAKVKASTG